MADDDRAVFERCPAFNIECQYVTEVDRLSAENERLREALLQMKRMPNYIRKDDNRKEMLKIISEALGETK